MQLNFKEWIVLESNFIQLSPEAKQGIEDIIGKFANTMSQNPSFTGNLGSIPFTDHKQQNRPIPVIVKNISGNGYYDPNNHQVFLSPRLFHNGNVDRSIYNVLSHEITHGVDPKYHPSMPDAWFDKGVAKGQFDSSKLSYEKSPLEFDAFGGGIAADIERQYRNLDQAGKQSLSQTITNWLKHGGPLPNIFQASGIHMPNWQSKPTLWRKFQQRIYNLIQKLQSEPATSI